MAKQDPFLVGRNDFAALFKLGKEELENGMDGRLLIKDDGVYQKPLDDHALEILEPDEIAVLSHPTGAPNTPLLSFPCTLAKLFKWRDSQPGLGFLDDQVVASWMRERAASDGVLRTSADDKPLGTRERGTLLRVIVALAKQAKIDLDEKAAERIAHAVALAGFSGPTIRTVRDIVNVARELKSDLPH